MRTLMLMGNLEVGGAEVMALRLAEALRERGGDVCAASLTPDGPLRPGFERAGVPLATGLMRFRYDLLAGLRVGTLLDRHAADTLLIVEIYRNAMICGLLGARLARRDVRTVLWASAVPGGQGGRFEPRLRRALRVGRLDGIVCVSEVQRDRLVEAGLDPRRVTTIPNGVNPDRLRGATPAGLDPPARGPVLLHLANVMPDKDHPTVLAAAGELHRRGTAFDLLLAGRGTDAPDFARRVRALAGDAPVRCLGLRDDAANLLALADAFVLPSTSEVCNLALLEALAVGLPIVTTDIPGFAGIFTHDVEGLKVPPRDPRALADALQRILTEPDLRDRLGLAGLQRGGAFTLDRTADRFEELLGGVGPDRAGAVH